MEWKSNLEFAGKSIASVENENEAADEEKRKGSTVIKNPSVIGMTIFYMEVQEFARI